MIEHEFVAKIETHALEQQRIISVLYVNLLDMEKNKEILLTEFTQISEAYRQLQDFNFDLEIKYFNNLQDLEIFEARLFKYQNIIKENEDKICNLKYEIKKLFNQKSCYESVSKRFKREMGLMSEQLGNLQKILAYSSEASKEENGQLSEAITNLQKVNDRLQSELATTEQRAVYENQINEARIEELEQIIGQKDEDLNAHDNAIKNMKTKLEQLLEENNELKNIVGDLKCTVCNLQRSVQNYVSEEAKNCENRKNIRQNLEDMKCELDERNCQLGQLQIEYKEKCGNYIAKQEELIAMKNNQKERICHMECVINELNEKLAACNKNNHELSMELKNLQKQCTQHRCRDSDTERELEKYKQIVAEVETSLIELNQNLMETQVKGMPVYEELKKNFKRISSREDFCHRFGCEIQIYKKIVEGLKDLICQLDKKIVETETKSNNLAKENKQQRCKIVSLQKKLMKKEKECEEYQQSVEFVKNQEQHLHDIIKNLKGEISQMQCKMEQITKLRNNSHNLELASTQEEIDRLKCEIKKMIQKQIALNSENEKLQEQITKLQASVAPLEKKNCTYKEQLEQYMTQMQNLKKKNKLLVKQNDNLNNEIHCIQCCYNELNKKYRYLSESVNNLEMELFDTKSNRNEICVESRNVIDNVKAWLIEQRKIDEQIQRKSRNAIEKLRHENELLLCQIQQQSKYSGSQTNNNYALSPSPPQPLQCQSLWSLGSQGTGSLVDVNSQGGYSPISCNSYGVDGWYSPTFRDDDETTDDEYVNKIENYTSRMRRCNRIYRDEYLVSRDGK